MPADGPAADTGEDAALEVDAAPAVCADGHRDPGEACFGPPITRDAGDSAEEAQLADVDGDGDLDLVFTTGLGLAYLPYEAGAFATSPVAGPAVTGSKFRAFNAGGDSRLELITGDVGGVSTWQTSGTSTAYTSTFAATLATVKPTAFELAKVTGAALPDVVSSYGDDIFIGTYNTSMVLTNATNRNVYKTSAIATGALDGDAFADVAVAAVGGIVVFRGGAAGLSAVIDTPHDTLVNGLAIADLDGDGTSDLVFTDSGTSGSIGWMRGLGNMTYAAAETKSVANLGFDIAITDVDGDGRADVVGARVRGTLAVLVFHGQANGTLGDPVELPYPFATLTSLYANADYTGDGVADIVTSVRTTGEIAIYPSQP